MYKAIIKNQKDQTVFEGSVQFTKEEALEQVSRIWGNLSEGETISIIIK